MKCRFQFAGLPIVFVAALAGCGPESKYGTVDGTVTLDGAPLNAGIIRFLPTDGRTPTADATVTGGTFTARIPVGEKRVTISAPSVVGKRKVYETPDSPTVDVVEELLPERYNLHSELTLTVEPGHIEKQFKLKSE